MTKENLQPISELMTSALAPIHTHLNQMDKRLDAIETRLDSMAEDIYCNQRIPPLPAPHATP